MLIKINRKTLNIRAIQGTNRDHSNLRLGLLVNLGAYLGNPLRRACIQHPGEVVNVASGLKLLNLLSLRNDAPLYEAPVPKSVSSTNEAGATNALGTNVLSTNTAATNLAPGAPPVIPPPPKVEQTIAPAPKVEPKKTVVRIYRGDKLTEQELK